MYNKQLIYQPSISKSCVEDRKLVIYAQQFILNKIIL